MADVFISYQEENAGELAEQMADALDGAGISCWCARRDLPFGGDFARVIPLQIETCKVFLLLLNDSKVHQSNHMENELGLAFERLRNGENILILPLEFGDFKRKTWIKYYLVHTQSVRLPKDPDEQLIQGVVKRIAERLNPQKPIKIIRHGECGQQGNNVMYMLENGVLTISGNGSMRDFELDNKENVYDTPWRNECKTIFRVEIQSGVTTIGNGAFDECAELASVSIPESVISIGIGAFDGCQKLESVNIPDSVVSIEIGAFTLCAKLTNVTIPDSVTYIGDMAFMGCEKLTSASVPTKVIIPSNAFPPITYVTRRP